MKIAFVSNFLSTHQQPICEALTNMNGVEFRFIALSPISLTRRQMGWGDLNNISYVVRTYIDSESKVALSFVSNADIVIFGHDNDDIYFRKAIENKNNIIFRCSERLYKNGRWRVFSLRGLRNRWLTYYRYPRNRQYLLCSSAYAAKDFALTGSFLGKSYKWGYFPPNNTYSYENQIASKKTNSIFWAGRMIGWKHPEVAIKVAKFLSINHVSFEMNIAGDGPLFDEIQQMIINEGLDENVHLLGGCSQEEVRKFMARSEIYLATSDYQEGWGAVINEAMSECCAVIGCKAMGAVPYLIVSGKNGFSYEYGQLNQLYNQVKTLILNKELLTNIMKEAYLTIQSEWNANCAAQRLVELSKSLLRGKTCNFESGPCSKAELI